MTAALLAALGGAIIAMLLGLFGGGGSVLATPWLLYAVGIADPHVAIGTGAAAVTLNAGANLALQARAGTVTWPFALSFAGAGLAGSLAGAALAQQVDGTALMGGFALAMLAVGLAMLRPPRDAGDPLGGLQQGFQPGWEDRQQRDLFEVDRRSARSCGRHGWHALIRSMHRHVFKAAHRRP